MAGLDHVRQFMLHREEHASHVDTDDTVPVFFALLRKRRGRRQQPGIVEGQELTN